MAREHEIPRTVFTAEQLRKEPKLPGFFDNGPAHFDEHLLDGENLLNTVEALAMIIKTSEGYMQASAVRSFNEERQPNVASSITARQPHAIVRGIMTHYKNYRTPLLGNDPVDIPNEGYHVTGIDPTTPIFVADYLPAPHHQDIYLDTAYKALIAKMRPRAHTDNSIPRSRVGEKILPRVAGVWPGPMIVGVSEIGEGTAFWTPETPYEPDETLFEANIMGTIVAAIDMSELTAGEVRALFTVSNQHYSHFDLAPVNTFDQAVKNGVVDLITPQFKDHNIYVKGLDLPLYILACAKGLCLRAAALALMRHINYAREMFGDDPIGLPEPADTKKIYQMPKKLLLPNR